MGLGDYGKAENSRDERRQVNNAQKGAVLPSPQFMGRY